MTDDDRIEGAARDIGGKFQAAVGDLTGDTATQVRGRLNQAAGRAQNAIGGAADEARDLANQLGEVIKERPMTSTGIALGVGFALGCLWRR